MVLLRLLRNALAGRGDEARADAPLTREVEPREDDVGEAYRRGGEAQEAGRWDEAEASYRRVLALDPAHVEANVNLALVLRSAGRAPEAVPYLFRAAAAVPKHAEVRRLLADSLVSIEITSASDTDRATLASLCDDERISTLALFTAVAGLVKRHPGFDTLVDRADEPAALALPAPALSQLMRDRLLLAALPRMLMADITVESGLTRLRRSILLRTDLATCKIEASFGAPLGLLCALARNCFLAGYVWLAQDDERARVASLRARIQTSLRDATEEALAIVAMYMPLRTLSESPTLRERKWTSEFMPVAKEQIDDWLVETELAARLIPATAIDDDVSLAVREQYESNPYPRWVSVGDPGLISFGRLYEHLVGHAPATPPSEPLRILIAGCGSGRHPVQAARGFPAADILAIDLSLASLAYASRMTAALGIGNVTYRQGDILKLSQLDTKFDIVESCGVLHHLRDPMAGWRVLRGLLAPDGLMQIALYSRHARESVNRARALAHALGISGKADDLRRFRHTIADLPESDPTRGVVRWSDFFSLDEFRDLVMHVQEHQFTLPQIGQCVSELGLRVLALEVEGETKTDFERMFPGRDPRTDLQAWDRFEQAHPDTFRGMYRFWCRAA